MSGMIEQSSRTRRHAAIPLLERPPIPSAPMLVAGLGRAGRSALEALSALVGPDHVQAWDADTGRHTRRTTRRLLARGTRVWLGAPPTNEELGEVAAVIKSPGIGFDTSLIQQAAALGLYVLDELELGWRLSRAPIVAVTGTNGKSTTAGALTSILTAAGMDAKLAGNTVFGVPLCEAARAGADVLVTEVSSYQLEGCDQLLPEVGVFTNLTAEHLGRHRTLERYGALKRRLFVRDGRAVSRAVVNVDGDFGRRLASEIERRGGQVARVGFAADADYRVDGVEWDLRRARVLISAPLGALVLATRLPGRYNACNVAAALATADLLGIERAVTVPVISSYQGPPGRFEHIDLGQPFEVIVDFAHNPDGLEQHLTAVRAGMPTTSRVWIVLTVWGPPGTAIRRMGSIARQHSDRLVLTMSGFRGFSPVPALRAALHQVRKTPGGEVVVILDRHRALRHALWGAEPGDVVLIPGWGAEADVRADPRGVPIRFDAREVTRELLRERVRNGQRARAAVWPQSVMSTSRRPSTARSPSSAV